MGRHSTQILRCAQNDDLFAAKAKGIITIGIDDPPAYKDVTNDAVPYTLPKDAYPGGRP